MSNSIPQKEETYWHHLKAKIKEGCLDALPTLGVIILGMLTLLAAILGFGIGMAFIAGILYPSYSLLAGISGGMLGVVIWIIGVILIIDYLDFQEYKREVHL